jgi:hypothetical protein
VARGCEPSICVGQVAEIRKSRELESYLVENPSIGYSKSRVAKRRGIWSHPSEGTGGRDR